MAPIVMDVNVDFNDRRAWDDRALVESWEGALAEYKRYHSIHLEGKRVEDVLSAEELKELRTELGHDLDVDVDAKEIDSQYPKSVWKRNPKKEKTKEAVPAVETNETELEDQPQESADSAVPPNSATVPASMPQALLATVQDDHLKNAMMAWYYAGYYTGLHEGQQKATCAEPNKS